MWMGYFKGKWHKYFPFANLTSDPRTLCHYLTHSSPFTGLTVVELMVVGADVYSVSESNDGRLIYSIDHYKWGGD